MVKYRNTLVYKLLQNMDKMLSELAELEKYEGPPKYSCKELTAEEGYPITSMKRMDGKFGPSVVAEITLPDGGGPAITFLPQRFVTRLSDEQIENFNKGGFRLKCTGMSGRSINLLFFK